MIFTAGAMFASALLVLVVGAHFLAAPAATALPTDTEDQPMRVYDRVRVDHVISTAEAGEGIIQRTYKLADGRAFYWVQFSSDEADGQLCSADELELVQAAAPGTGETYLHFDIDHAGATTVQEGRADISRLARSELEELITDVQQQQGWLP